MKRALLLGMSLILLAVTVAEAKRMAPRPRPPKAPPPTAAQASNLFAVGMYQQVRDQKGNLIFSPVSISLALGMTVGGANGETAAQMQRVFHLDQFATVDDAQAAQAALQDGLTKIGKTKGTELRLANQLWGQKGYPFAKAFLAASKKHYGAGAELVDFTSKAAKVRVQINKWVEKQTKKRIKDLLPDGSITAATRLVLVNAIYMKASWASKFKKSDTHDGAFMLDTGDTVQAPLMNQNGAFKYGQIDGLRVLEMPYQGSDLAMDVFLSDDLNGLAAMEQQLATAGAMDRWLGALALANDVAVTLPRFTATLELSLSKTLMAMGMPLAFDGGAADFSRMVEKTADSKLFISDVFHKAFIAVDEAGAEAAAATAVVMNDGDAVHETPTFRADHPFIYLIRDTKTGVILFMGRVVDPR